MVEGKHDPLLDRRLPRRKYLDWAAMNEKMRF
jgi:hypothetical protein